MTDTYFPEIIGQSRVKKALGFYKEVKRQWTSDNK